MGVNLAPAKVEPVNSGMITPANTIPSAQMAPSATRMIQKSVDASLNASRLRPC